MKVLNFGSLNIDYVYQVDHIVSKGETLLSNARDIFTGGKGLNQSVAMGRAGLEVYHAGSIGKEGRFLLDELKKAHVNYDYVKELEKVPTGHTVIQNSSDGDNCILLFGGANQKISEQQIDETLSHFITGDFLVMQNEISNLFYLVNAGKKKGMKLVLNPSPMDREILELPLKDIDYFFLNEIEAAQLCKENSENVEALVEGLQNMFPNAVSVLTLGEKGSIYIGPQGIIRQEVFPVKPVDTTAAGDTFSGFFLAGLVRNMSPADCLKLASCASAITVTRHGAAPSIPSMSEVMQMYNSVRPL